MKTKFKFKAKDIKYIVNDDAIICIVVPDDSLIPYEMTMASYQINHYPIDYPPYFKGIARFKDGDVRDVEIGKEIARQKAYRAAFRWYYKTYDKIWHKLVSEFVTMGEYIDSAAAKAKECNDVINNLTKL